MGAGAGALGSRRTGRAGVGNRRRRVLVGAGIQQVVGRDAAARRRRDLQDVSHLRFGWLTTPQSNFSMAAAFDAVFLETQRHGVRGELSLRAVRHSVFQIELRTVADVAFVERR